MSALRGDARLRSLERAAAGGDVEAQARQLLERVRAGTLTRERLELAAYCGDAPAREVVPATAVPVPAGPSDFPDTAGDWPSVDGAPIRPWMTGLGRWGRPLQVRALLALCEVVAEEIGYWTTGPCPIAAVRTWVDGRAARPDGAGQVLPYGEPLWAWWLLCAADGAALPWPGSFDSNLESCLDAALAEVERKPAHQAIRDALIAWALGPSPAKGAP